MAKETKPINKLVYGAVIGDYFGSIWEYTSYVGEKPATMEDINFKKGDYGYTDDSIMTVAVADTLLNHKPVANTLRDYAYRFPCPRGGYGGRFSTWINNPDMPAYGSFGNGAGMRVSPVAYFALNEADCDFLADHVTEVTHNHEEGTKGAETVAGMVYRALHGATKSHLRDYAFSKYGDKIDRDLAQLHQTVTMNDTCQATVPLALYCFLSSVSFEDCLRRCIYIGGDTDTIAAMACAIASAFYKDIPDYLYNKVRKDLPKDFLNVLDNVPLPEELKASLA